MNPKKCAGPNCSEPESRGGADALPISLSVVVIIADARKASRVGEAGREQSFAANLETLAALPGHLAGLLRGASGDAQRELNRFLAMLVQPEPPAAETVPRPAPSPAEPQAPTPAHDYITLSAALPLL